jgi:hypothetical protein
MPGRRRALHSFYAASADWASTAPFVTMLVRIKGIEVFAGRARVRDLDTSTAGGHKERGKYDARNSK